LPNSLWIEHGALSARVMSSSLVAPTRVLSIQDSLFLKMFLATIFESFAGLTTETLSHGDLPYFFSMSHLHCSTPSWYAV